jgi:hypothetical protein
MKRIQDKIKDLVEPQSFEQVGNFAEDPAQALAAYRFTDVTSDLLSRWFDALTNLPPGRGAAHALAGPRGVGKTHTLAVMAALVGSERLRSTVEDAHVSASASRLANRRCAVVRVERGTRPTLSEELAAAFARSFGGDEAQWVRPPAEALAVAASRAAVETLFLVVDTSFNRPARVARDDGPALAALADAARNLDAFVALALDDDIADADGANVAVAAAYRIDYLDPDNLYRVADQYVLRKKPQVGDALREIYQSFRATVHEFNWSQARFSSVYPIHPLVAEVASGVRLYVPTFAFLPFAASAAARATSRPALSLVLLDEVFDAAEEGLRKASELRRAFAAYDYLNERRIALLPIMQRYQARLILKSLFILSLDGRDVTPGEMCAALLLNDEDAGGDAPRRVAEILARFASESAPGSFVLAAGPGGETRYRFRVSAPGVLDSAPPHDHRSPYLRADGSAADGKAESSNTRAVAGEILADLSAGPQAAAQSLAGAGPSAEDVARAQTEADAGGRFKAEPEVSKLEHEREGDGALAAEARAAALVNGAPPFAKDDARPLDAGLVEWARLLTGKSSQDLDAAADARVEVRARLAAWLTRWRALALEHKFDALPDTCLTTRAWKAEESVRKSFGRAAYAVEASLAGKSSPEEALAKVADAFRNSPAAFERCARLLEDLTEFVEGHAERERVRAYLASAEATGVDEMETVRRELLALAEDPNNFLEAGKRERFARLWDDFRARYGEHYAAVHDKTVGARDGRESLQALRRTERWREFESLSRLPVLSTQVWRQAESLLRFAEGSRCDLPVRRLLEGQPVCACGFRLSRAAEFGEVSQELEAMMERGLAVYRRTLLLLGANLAISLDALARREEDEEAARRARTLSAAFAQGHAPERFARQEVDLIERALRRMSAPPPVRVVAPNGDAGLLTREELRARFDQWLDELPERPVLIEVVSKAEINAP